MSPRTLHFSSQLFWECRTLQACETFPEGMPDGEQDYEDLEGAVYPNSLKDWRGRCEGTDIWVYLVEIFGRCSITKLKIGLSLSQVLQNRCSRFWTTSILQGFRRKTFLGI